MPIPTPIRQHAFSFGCFVVALVLLAALDFTHRGPRFHPAAAKTDRAGTYDLARARTLARVVGQVRAHYVEPERIHPKEMAVAALLAVQRQVPEVLVAVERAGSTPKALEVTVDQVRKRFSLARVGDLYELNWKLMDIFDFLERSLPPLVDLEELEQSAINGLLSTLDPHSLLLPPRVYREMQLGQRGRFGGLGISVHTQEGVLTISSVMPGTPAAEAQLAAEDQIVQIDADSAINMDLNEAVNLLRGAPGSRVTLWIRRAGWPSARPVPLTRREIVVRSVQVERLGDGIGYAHIRSFQDSTTENLRTALADLRADGDGLRGLVLDLRDNPGGLLDQATGVSDAFLDRGTIVTTVRDGTRDRDESHATRADTLTDLPLVVLINGGSASASEIVAGALKRNDRAVVLGERSFGKGSVQVVYRIDEAALKLTIAQYLTPGDVSIQGVGIVPDVEVQPLSVRKGAIDLVPPDDARGEADLTSHLSSQRVKDIRPSVVMRLLEDGDDPSHQRRAEETFKADARVRLAKGLLVAAPAPNRKQALVQAAGFLKGYQRDEENRLVALMKGVSVDWRSGPKVASPRLDVALEIAPTQGQGLVAGGLARVRASVTNRGALPVYRIHGVLHSAVKAIDGDELAFGVIAPGATVTRTHDVRLPRSLGPTGDRVALHLFADAAPVEIAGRTMIETGALDRPHFAHVARLLDPDGNGDGLIQRGETLTLRVAITNVGAGAAGELLATLKNASGGEVFIIDGRRELDGLAVGETAWVDFRFEVKRGLKARNVQLTLGIHDHGMRVSATQSVSMRVFPAGYVQPTPRSGVALVGAAATGVYSGAHRDTPEIAEIPANAVVAVVAEADGWLEIAWREDGRRHTGWIAADRATVGDHGGPAPGAVTSVIGPTPPAVTWSPPSLTTTARSANISGVVRFSGSGTNRRHMYVYRGKDKVFFASARSQEAVRDELPFSAEIPLEPGENDITIIARQGEEQVTRRRMTIFRGRR